MTTATTSAVIDHTSDAGFRAWGLDFASGLAACGLVQTADTGQINWVTALRPTADLSAGYEIWRFADSSLYLKFEYGTANAGNVPMMWVTVGQGSNGSGTLTGTLSTRDWWTYRGGSNASTVTLRTSYFCHTADYLAICWKKDASGGTYPYGILVIAKSVDATGAATTDGFAVLKDGISINGGPLLDCMRMESVRMAATAVAYGDTYYFALFPGTPTTSVNAAGDNQAYPLSMYTPKVCTFLPACGYVIADITRYTTFSVALVGSTPHTYLALGQACGFASMDRYDKTVYSIAMLWE